VGGTGGIVGGTGGIVGGTGGIVGGTGGIVGGMGIVYGGIVYGGIVYGGIVGAKGAGMRGGMGALVEPDPEESEADCTVLPSSVFRLPSLMLFTSVSAELLVGIVAVMTTLPAATVSMI